MPSHTFNPHPFERSKHGSRVLIMMSVDPKNDQRAKAAPTDAEHTRLTGFIRSAGHLTPSSTLHFEVTADLPEVRAYALERGW